MEAVETSRPTPGSAEFLRACQRAGVLVAVVSNNSEPAIRRYLKLHQLDHLVAAIAGRPAGRPQHMKPDPYLLREAIHALGTSTAQTVLIGDSTSDVEAAARVGVPTIGYANKPGKADRLGQAGASLVVDDMRALAQAVVTS